MFTYLKFGLPRVVPPGTESESTDGEEFGRREIPRGRLRSARSEEVLDRVENIGGRRGLVVGSNILSYLCVI